LIKEALRVWLDSGEYSSPEGRPSDISWIVAWANSEYTRLRYPSRTRPTISSDGTPCRIKNPEPPAGILRIVVGGADRLDHPARRHVAIGWWNDGRVIAMEFSNIHIGAAVLPSQESSDGRI
jgi:hypothetical protein